MKGFSLRVEVCGAVHNFERYPSGEGKGWGDGAEPRTDCLPEHPITSDGIDRFDA